VRYRVADGVVIDRRYRGAVVLAGGKLHELDEAGARVLDSCRWADATLATTPAMLADLVARGIVQVNE